MPTLVDLCPHNGTSLSWWRSTSRVFIFFRGPLFPSPSSRFAGAQRCCSGLHAPAQRASPTAALRQSMALPSWPTTGVRTRTPCIIRREQPVTASRGRTGPSRHPVLSAIQPRKGVASVGRSVLGDVFRRSNGGSNRSNRRVVAGPYHPQSARALVGERRSPRLICDAEASTVTLAGLKNVCPHG